MPAYETQLIDEYFAGVSDKLFACFDGFTFNL